MRRAFQPIAVISLFLFPGAAGAENSSPVRAYATNAVSIKPAATALNACDLNQDGIVNIVDVQWAVNMYLGLMPCTANIEGAGVCNTDVVNLVSTAAMGGTCVVTSHSVTLNWSASTSSNVSGYNVYRANTWGGPYTIMNSSPVATTTYTDYSVLAGQAYYYVATAVDTYNNESIYSNEAQAIVPSP
jgi:hypothetical protein